MPYPSFFLRMITINPNTVAQTIYVSPYQARKFLPTITHYLLVLEEVQSGKKYYVIPAIDTDNDRYSELTFNTNADSGASGSILLKQSGQYIFSIYGQTNNTNLDPTNVAVQGLMEVGACLVVGEDIATIPSITIPNNVIYYE